MKQQQKKKTVKGNGIMKQNNKKNPFLTRKKHIHDTVTESNVACWKMGRSN